MRYIIVFGLAILLSSCASTTANHYTQTVQSWRGGNANDLVQRWGRPDSTGTGTNGNKMYVYRTQSMRNNGAPASPSIGVTTSSSGRPVMNTYPSGNMSWNRGIMSQTCTAAFEADNSGKIINTDIQGTGCYGSQGFANRLANPNAKVVN